MNSKIIVQIVQEIDDAIDSSLGNNVPESEKEQLLESLIDLVRNHIKELQTNVNINSNSIYANNFTNRQLPLINLYFLDPRALPSYPQNYYYSQPPIAPSTLPPPSSPILYNPPSYPLPMLQNQTIFNTLGQFPLLSPPKHKKHHKKDHKKSKTNKDKDHKESKSSKRSKSKEKKSKPSSSELTFEYKEGLPFKGIFNHLTLTASGNPHMAGIVQVESSSRQTGNVEKILDPDWNNYFSTQDRPLQWISFTFNKNLVSLTGYSMKTHSTPGNGHTKSWRVEGSMNGADWVLIHKINDSDALCSAGAVYTAKLDKKTEFFKKIKFTQIGPNSKSFHNFRVSCIELFGSLKSD